MKPRVFLAHRQGFAWFTSPHLSFMKLRKSRRARARRCRKLSGVISNTSAATVSLTPKMAPRMKVKRCSQSRQRSIPEVQESIASVTSRSDRAADVINRLRSFYMKGVPPEREMVDIKEIVREMTTLLRKEAVRHSIKIYSELAEDLPNVLADRVQLQQVFMN